MLNPPSLSGAEELVSLLAGAIALMVATAAVTVWLTERDSMSEREFERLVERSEQLAGQPQAAIEQNEFDTLVADAIDELPDEFRAALEQVPVVVSRLGAEHRAYGHYYGDTIARDNFEERIVIYQDTLERDFGHDPRPAACAGHAHAPSRGRAPSRMGRDGRSRTRPLARLANRTGEVSEWLKERDWKSRGRG